MLNAANEVAVEAFLKGRITFLEIEDLVEKSLASHNNMSNPDLSLIEEIDRETREFVNSLIQ